MGAGTAAPPPPPQPCIKTCTFFHKRFEQGFVSSRGLKKRRENTKKKRSKKKTTKKKEEKKTTQRHRKIDKKKSSVIAKRFSMESWCTGEGCVRVRKACRAGGGRRERPASRGEGGTEGKDTKPTDPTPPPRPPARFSPLLQPLKQKIHSCPSAPALSSSQLCCLLAFLLACGPPPFSLPPPLHAALAMPPPDPKRAPIAAPLCRQRGSAQHPAKLNPFPRLLLSFPSHHVDVLH